jgi:hypothetical protein
MERGRTSAGLGTGRAPVYFNFGDSEPGDTPRFDTPTLWRLNPCGPNGWAYLSPVSKTAFLHIHLKGLPFEEDYSAAVERAAARYLILQAPRSRGLPVFERYIARREARRRRF